MDEMKVGGGQPGLETHAWTRVVWPQRAALPGGSGRAGLAGWAAVRERGSLVVLGSAPISRHSLTELNLRVLRALEPSRYQTIDTVRELLGVQRSAARAELTRLRDQELAEDNGEHPLAFRRTVRGDEALKWSR